MQNPPRLPELFHGNEEVSVEVDGPCLRMGGGAGNGRELPAYGIFTSEMSFRSGITCVRPAQVSNSASAIKNGLQTGQSAVKN